MSESILEIEQESGPSLVGQQVTQQQTVQESASHEQVDQGQADQLAIQLGILSKLRGETQSSLSKKCNLSRATINRYFNGKTDIRGSDLVNLLAVLGIDVVGDVNIELEMAYDSPGETESDRREQIYRDVVSVLRGLDRSVRKTVFEQLIWWSALNKKNENKKRNRSAHIAKESARRISSYLLRMVN